VANARQLLVHLEVRGDLGVEEAVGDVDQPRVSGERDVDAGPQRGRREDEVVFERHPGRIGDELPHLGSLGRVAGDQDRA
jgi:hypothetical protein